MSVADIIAKRLNGEAISNDEYAKLQAAVDNVQTPVNVRVRALPFVVEPTELTPGLIKKLYTTLTNLLADELPAVHHAVIQATATLAETAVKKADAAKSAEVVRDLCDILVQIAIEGSGFTLDLRKEAKEVILSRMAVASIAGVTTKVLHLLSNDRWNDTPEQLEAERKIALELFHAVATNEKYKELWTEELETKVLKFIAAVYPALSSNEMGRLLSSAAKIPTIAAKQGSALVDTILKLKLDAPRGIESVAKLHLVVPKDAVNDAIVDKLLPVLAKASGADPFSVQAARAFALAAEHVSVEKAPAVLAAARAALAKDKGFSVTYTEALLHSIAASLAKSEALASETFNDAAFLALVTSKAEAASKAEQAFSFATKKAAAANEATVRHAEAIEALKHIARIGAFLGEKKVPLAQTPSWAARKHVPKAPVKREVNIDAPIQPKRAQPAARKP